MAEMPKIVVLTDDELTALIDSSVTKAIAPLSDAIAKINAGTPATTPGQQTGGETGGNGTQSPVDTGSAPGQPSGQETTTLSLVPNEQVTTGDWNLGVWVADDAARISVASNPALAKGQTAALPDGTTRKVINVEVFNDKTSVTFDGNKLDPSKVAGKAVVFTVPKSEGSPAPVTPSVPANDPPPAPSTATKLTNIPMVGVNFGAHPNASQVQPGEAGTHYKWFSKKDVDYWVGEQGVRLIRWPYELQRSMVAETSTGLPSKTCELDSTFKAKVRERYEWIRAASNGEAWIIFDPHHYWRAWRNQTANGKQTGALLAAGEAAGQGNRWKRQERILIDDRNGWGAKELGLHLANFARELDDPMVLGFGMGNEPYPSSGGFDGITWQEMEKKVVADLNIALPIFRTVTKKPAFVCGNWWASARNWAEFSASFVGSIKDPANNIIFEKHGYGDLSNDSSGKYQTGDLNAFPTDQLTKVFTPAYKYFSAKGVRSFIGETGIPPTDSARAALAVALDDAEKANVPVTLWVAAGDGAMNGEKMYLDDAAHAKTREMLKPRFAKRFAEWTPVRG
ncbi:glycoside hydrolase family protein [Pseudomonas luteola]|uniref:Glycoside hydrolase family protein n=1 Tax=Pseudomonas luteola TaxID=47886 RepID=A0A2X2CPG4_PSELU|nr:cellulase family glycosylhydrolase [Pseudomonas luteola]SPZ07526.1 glycoside hydrolase family protein [Pseudomonas luteola]